MRTFNLFLVIATASALAIATVSLSRSSLPVHRSCDPSVNRSLARLETTLGQLTTVLGRMAEVRVAVPSVSNPVPDHTDDRPADSIGDREIATGGKVGLSELRVKDIPAKQSSAIEQIRPLEGNERSLTRQFFWASYGSILRQFGWPDQILFGGAAVTFSYSYAGGGRRLKFSFVDGRMMRATN